MREFKLVVVGGGSVGKSALSIQYIQHNFVEEYDPTIEEHYRKQVVVDEICCYLNILDTAGQEDFAAIRDNYLRSGEGFLMIFSITDRTGFDELKKLHEQILRVKDAERVPCVVVGNKSDLESSRRVKTEEGEALAKSLGSVYIEASAKTRTNVDESFAELVRLCLKENQASATTVSTKEKKRCVIL